MADKGKDEDKGITAKKEDDMPEWYEQVCLKAELAEFSDVKGCMVVRPNGYSIWEKIQEHFNKVLKTSNTRNAAFPLFIPEHYFKKEADHAKGFSPEVAWVTHAGSTKLEEKLAVRPTSETVICESFKKWLRSYRDLPIKVNQWCSVVRWETKQTKLFLRSREFWWQEGHCIYETEKECVDDCLFYLNEYKKLSENLLAVPVLMGVKTQKEKFAGAIDTYAVESFMPDGKALQMGTSHNLGQGFMKVFGVNFVGKDEKNHLPYYNSWGISTRLLGGLIMVHSDNKGLVLPPKAAENKLVIIPILFEKTKDKVLEKVAELEKELEKFDPLVDAREEYSPGWKFHEWELKGIPLRIEIGPKDLEKDQVVVARRDTGEKAFVPIKKLQSEVQILLDKVQHDLFAKAKKFLDESIVEVSSMKELQDAIKNKKLAKVLFCCNPGCEDEIKDKTSGATSRCIPFEDFDKHDGKCIHCGKEARSKVFFSKSY